MDRVQLSKKFGDDFKRAICIPVLCLFQEFQILSRREQKDPIISRAGVEVQELLDLSGDFVVLIGTPCMTVEAGD